MMSQPQIHERLFGVMPDGSDRYACTGPGGVTGSGPTAESAYCDYCNKLQVKQYNDARGGSPVQKLSDLDQIVKVMIDKGWRQPGQTEPPLPEAVGLLIDLVMSLQETKATLRQRLLQYEEPTAPL
jgi:hypothetical protein